VSGVGEAVTSHRLEYRALGEPAWREGHPLTPLPGGRLVGSIFVKAPDTDHEVRVTLTGQAAGPLVLTGNAHTRAERFPGESGRTLYVSAEAKEGGDGSKDRPFASIQQGADRVEPGDVVLVLPGTYRERVTVSRSGRPDAYITFRPSGEVFLTGTFAELEQKGQGRWQAVGEGLYVTPFPGTTGFVAADGRRLYHYSDRAALEKLANGEPGGWYLSPDSKELYVKLSDGSDPDDHVLQVGERDGAFQLRGVRYVIIEGFRMGYFGGGPYGSAVSLEDASNCVIRKNSISCVRTGISISGSRASDNLVEENEVSDNSIFTWPWAANKAHDTEGAGISVRGYRGNVVRRNRIHGPFNAIASSMWGDLDNEERNADLDVYDNETWEIGDDCLEPEGACINNRFWGNLMHDCHMGVSLAPIRVGPTYVLRSVVYRYRSSGIKYSVDSFGVCYIYHNVCYADAPEQNALSAYGPWGNHQYRNNVFRGTRYVMEDTTRGPHDAGWDYDCLFTTAPGLWMKWANVRYNAREEWVAAKGSEEHGIAREPGFVDPAKGDFHLRPDSPCIDAGLRIPNINDDFAGKAPDMGCFEYRGP
jgi:parallel beta-helix repeat protein